MTPAGGCEVDAVVPNEAVDKLDPRMGEIVEMRFLGGLSIDEIAGVLGVSDRTVDRTGTSRGCG